MAPLHNSDLDSDRFKDSEWRTFQLWENLAKLKKVKKRRWILLTMFTFTAIASIHPIRERIPYWQAKKNVFNVHLALKHEIVRNLTKDHSLLFQITTSERVSEVRLYSVANCEANLPALESAVWSHQLEPGFQWIQEKDLSKLGLDSYQMNLCYVSDRGFVAQHFPLRMGVIPSTDLEQGRVDRISTLLIEKTDSFGRVY